MFTLTQRSVLLALALAASATAATAQSVPNLTGTWVMDAAKSDFGPMPAPKSRSDVIDHREPSLMIKRTIVQDGGASATIELNYGIDGKTYPNTTPQGTITSTLAWEGPVLVITSHAEVQGGTADIVDRMTLSADGKTLTQARTILVQGQEINQAFVLARQ
jgi:hypothetical protein